MASLHTSEPNDSQTLSHVNRVKKNPWKKLISVFSCNEWHLPALFLGSVGETSLDRELWGAHFVLHKIIPCYLNEFNSWVQGARVGRGGECRE